MNGWFLETSLPTVVDKNRAWLGMLQTVHALDPNYKIIVCLRDPIQIFGSIEAQHKKTILLSFPDHMNPNSAWHRGDQLFSPGGVVGGPIRSIENMQDIPREYGINEQVYFMIFERLMDNPEAEMNRIFKWANLSPISIDPMNLPTKRTESDSYYKFKYLHGVHNKIIKPKPYDVSTRIAKEIFAKFRWFYDTFYPKAHEELRKAGNDKASNFGNGRLGPSDVPQAEQSNFNKETV
jgi:sulfotransferase